MRIMNSSIANPLIYGHSIAQTLVVLLTLFVPGCQNEPPPPQPMLNWYVFDEHSVAFREAAADPAINIIGMDDIWTAEFVVGWIPPWPEQAS